MNGPTTEHSRRDGDAGARRLWIPDDRAVLAFGLGAWLFLLLAVLAIDVYNVGGVRAYVGTESGLLLFWHLFREGSPIEWVQAILLLGVVYYAAIGASTSRWLDDDDQRGVGSMLGFIALGAMLMILEDTGNVTQELGAWAETLFGLPSGVIRSLAFGAIAAVMIYGPLRYLSHLRARPRAFRALLIGYGAYGAMASVEVVTNYLVPSFYAEGGRWVTQTLFGGRMLELTLPAGAPAPAGDAGAGITGYYLMDFVFEESIELIGAVFLLVGVLRLVRAIPTPRSSDSGERAAPSPATEPPPAR